jgi:hypothetical protein
LQTLKLFKHLFRIGVLASQKVFLSAQATEPGNALINDVIEANGMLRGLARLAAYAFDVRAVLHVYILMAWNEFHAGELARACELCELVMLVNAEYQYDEEAIEALKLISLCQIKLQFYKMCIHSSKLCLESALRINDQRTELQCYGRLALCYYYTGDLELCRYFEYK